MQRTSVSSGTIVSVGYEAASSTLELELSSGEVVQFFNVPLSNYIALIKAGSKDDYYQHNIKAMFESKPVTEEVITSKDSNPNHAGNN